MKKSNWLGIILSAVTIVFFLVWIPINAQRQGSAPVTVVNTAAEPVPIRAPSPIPVTGSLAVSNAAVPITAASPIPVTGIVAVSNATLPVTGTINVGGTASVNVVNDTSNPVVVQDVSNRARIPFRLWAKLGFVSGNAASYVAENEDIVPQGKVLVIEYVNSWNEIRSPRVDNISDPLGGNLIKIDGDMPEIYAFVPQVPYSFYSGSDVVYSCNVSETVSIRIPGGKMVRLRDSYSATASQSGLLHVVISGYLEDAQ
jgi:hypothetical protein